MNLSRIRICLLAMILTMTTACGSSSDRPKTGIDPADIQAYSRIVKQVYYDVPFSQDGTFYTDSQSGKIIVGIKQDNDRTRKLKHELRQNLPDQVEFIEVTYSRADLNKVFEKIQSKQQDIEEAGIEMTHLGIQVSEQKVNFVFNAFDQQKLKTEKEVETFMEQFVAKQEKAMLNVTYEPGMTSEVGG